jgi:hypothetical protein
MKQLIINFTNNQLEVIPTNINVEEVIEFTLSAALHYMTSTLNQAPDNHRPQLESYLFDQFNIAASTVLAQFSPTIMKEDSHENNRSQQQTHH